MVTRLGPTEAARGRAHGQRTARSCACLRYRHRGRIAARRPSEAVAASCHTTETSAAPFCVTPASVAFHPARKLRASVGFCGTNLLAGDSLDTGQIRAFEVR